MPAPLIKIRERFFIAAEGESERSFVTWLQKLSSEEGLHVHLDTVLLGGGGFKSMLKRAANEHKRRRQNGGAYRERFLLVDGDRAEQCDWSIEVLRSEASKHQILVCVQNPNHEGLLLRMMPGMEREMVDAASAERKLKSRWLTYQKPMNAHSLGRQFTIVDLLRAANADYDLAELLRKIGLLRNAPD